MMPVEVPASSQTRFILPSASLKHLAGLWGWRQMLCGKTCAKRIPPAVTPNLYTNSQLWRLFHSESIPISLHHCCCSTRHWGQTASKRACGKSTEFYPHRLVLARLLSCRGSMASFLLRARPFLFSSLGFCLRRWKCKQLEERIGWPHGNSSEKQPFLLQVKTVILNLVSCKNQTLLRHVGETFIKDGYILLNWPAYWSRKFLHASSPMKAAFHPSGPSKMLSATPSFYFIPLPLMRHKLYRHMPVYQITLQDRL